MRRVLNHLVIDKPTRYVPDRARAGESGSGLVGRCGLFERLGRAGRVTVVSAPAGSGKSVLLRSWIGAAGLVERGVETSPQGR